eukprot:4838966-Heterocapsa_arctica.AAC.6
MHFPRMLRHLREVVPSVTLDCFRTGLPSFLVHEVRGRVTEELGVWDALTSFRDSLEILVCRPCRLS